MPIKRRVTEPVKKIVAARQNWRCADCSKLLSAAYQVDHRVALADGGTNRPSNLAALCPNCHALKTQLEAIARADKLFAEGEDLIRQAKADAREDVAVPGTDMVRCTLCHQKRQRTETSWADHDCPKLQTEIKQHNKSLKTVTTMAASHDIQHPQSLKPTLLVCDKHDKPKRKSIQLRLNRFLSPISLQQYRYSTRQLSQ